MYFSLCIEYDFKGNKIQSTNHICDLLVLTQSDQPLLLTIVWEEDEEVNSYSTDIPRLLEQNLTLHGPTDFFVKSSLITSRGSESKTWLQDILNQQNEVHYPVAYKSMNAVKMTSIVNALFVFLASFTPHAYIQVGSAIQMMNILTYEQLDALNKCKLAQHIRIIGVAGTGKSVLGLELCHLYRQDGFEAHEVMYLTFSQLLAEKIR